MVGMFRRNGPCFTVFLQADKSSREDISVLWSRGETTSATSIGGGSWNDRSMEGHETMSSHDMLVSDDLLLCPLGGSMSIVFQSI